MMQAYCRSAKLVNNMSKIQAIRGMNDILPTETPIWQYLEKTLKNIVFSYGYQEIRLPILEKTELFARSIGEVTDIVEKEMYTFLDRNGDSLTLRPEVTAGYVRAGIEHGLLYNQVQRLWCMGPMFRYERPQKGRFRQFQQFDVEVFGIKDPQIDAELIAMTARFWRELGVEQQLTLHLNSLGSAASRAQYRSKLVNYFTQHQEALDEDSKRRLTANPLRILDSKNPAMQALIAEAPQMLEHLDEESDNHFKNLCEILANAGIHYTLNPRLVRGLDYYNQTVFEWMTHASGAQNTVCAGGRYDALVEQLGGAATPAVGFAMGLERIISLLETKEAGKTGQLPLAYFIIAGEKARLQGLAWAERIRDRLPQGTGLIVDCSGGNFKSQFKRADKSGARWALVLGDNEIQEGKIALKYLREEKMQELLSEEALIEFLQGHI